MWAWRSTRSPPSPIPKLNRARPAGSLMRRILRLRRIQLDVECLLFFVHVEILAEGLVALRDHLHQNRALRYRRDFDEDFLIGAQLPFGADLFAELGLGAPLDEFDHHARALDRLAARA